LKERSLIVSWRTSSPPPSIFLGWSRNFSCKFSLPCLLWFISVLYIRHDLELLKYPLAIWSVFYHFPF
jgi:hypothetical protein